MDDSHGSAGRLPAVPARPGDATVLSPNPGDAVLATASVNEIGRALEGRVLGQYRLDEFVGGGGMGAVFRALDTRLDRPVAVKVLSRRHSADGEMLRRFEVEAQSAARLDHQNIGRVYAVGNDDGWHYIVFEFIDGTNLRDLVARGGPIDVASTIRFTIQLAAALEHAATREVVHRDIKPSNIIITPDGRARLVDMGLARRHRITDEDDLTQTGMTLGTFDYISPEQARDPRAADVRSDLYSLGCTIYYMLAGRPPFADGTITQKLLHHQQRRAPAIESLRPDVPRGLAIAVQRLMEKEPADRYQTPAELIAELTPVAEACGIDAAFERPVIAAEPVVGPRRAPARLPWAVPLVALAAVVAGLLVQSVSQRTVPGAGAGSGATPATDRAPPVAPGAMLRVVDEPSAPIDRGSVAAALATAADGDVVELAFDGTRDEPPWNVRGRNVTLRAAAGRAPVVRFSATPADAPAADGTPGDGACRIAAGGLTIEGIGIIFDAGAGPLFSIVAGGALACDAVEIEAALAQGEQGAAGVEPESGFGGCVVRFVGPDRRPDDADPPPPCLLRFQRTTIAGAGSFLEAAGSGTVACEWQGGGCDLAGRFVIAEGSARSGGPGVSLRLDLASATFECGDGFAWLLDSPARPVQPHLRVSVDGCRFVVPEGRALVEQSGIDVPAVYRTAVEWIDHAGRYEGSGVWRRIDGSAERIDLDYASSPRPLVHLPAVVRPNADR